jgi:hypothetical protein
MFTNPVEVGIDQVPVRMQMVTVKLQNNDCVKHNVTDGNENQFDWSVSYIREQAFLS